MSTVKENTMEPEVHVHVTVDGLPLQAALEEALLTTSTLSLKLELDQAVSSLLGEAQTSLYSFERKDAAHAAAALLGVRSLVA